MRRSSGVLEKRYVFACSCRIIFPRLPLTSVHGGVMSHTPHLSLFFPIILLLLFSSLLRSSSSSSSLLLVLLRTYFPFFSSSLLLREAGARTHFALHVGSVVFVPRLDFGLCKIMIHGFCYKRLSFGRTCIFHPHPLFQIRVIVGLRQG